MGMAWFVSATCGVILLSLSLVASDQPDCTSQLEQMQGCLPFVEGTDKIPSTDCCGGLKKVFTSSPVCLCELITPNGQFSTVTEGLNITQALLLPAICKVDAQQSRCKVLLGGSSPTEAPSPSSSPHAGPKEGGGQSNYATIEKAPGEAFLFGVLIVQALMRLAIY